MAGRRRRGAGDLPFAVDPELALLADVRRAPVRVREGGQLFEPEVVLLARAEDGMIVGSLAARPGQPARTLMQALLQTLLAPVAPGRPALPGRVVLVNPQLANEVRPLLASLGVEVVISPPIEPFDRMFVELFDYLARDDQAGETLEVADETLKPLLAAAERLWRARPWEYAYDEPPFGLVPSRAGARPLYASVLGALREVLGVALYTRREDYETTLELGESNVEGRSAPAEDAEALQHAFRGRIFLVTFEPRDETKSAYRDQLARCGWSRRLSVVPTFEAFGGGEAPGELTAQEAGEVAVAMEALATFCQLHRREVTDEAFPLRDRVAVEVGGQTIGVEVSVPPDEPSLLA